MKGDIEKLEEENEFLLKLALKQRSQLQRMCELNKKRAEIEKQLEENRKCLLIWQTKTRIGIKNCKSMKEAWEFIKENTAIHWSMIDGYVFSSNWEEDKAYERK